MNKSLFQVVIGLEIHAHINSNTKLFSRSPNFFGDEPNTNVKYLDVGMPGMLPLLNKSCVEKAIRTGLALNGMINQHTVFERKHYFYPDLPQGYQISQLRGAVVLEASLDIIGDNGKSKTIHINRIQLEQDAGKSIHDDDQDLSYIDLNRAGCPLMEIVSEPDISSSDEAVKYIKSIISVLRAVDSSGANMEKGEFRVDANVSINRHGEQYGNRVEIKNLNSTRFLKQAIDYEIDRQISVVASGNEVEQETRLFNVKKGITEIMRKKADAQDYCYFRDPDLLPLNISDQWIEEIRATIPELPKDKLDRLESYTKLSRDKLLLLIEDDRVLNIIESLSKTLEKNNEKHLFYEKIETITNLISTEMFAYMNKEDKPSSEIELDEGDLIELSDIISRDEISMSAGKQVFNQMIETRKRPREIIDELDLMQISDESAIESAVNDVISSSPKQVEQYEAGKTALFGFFVGKTMQKLRGKGNPKLINQILERKLN